MRRRTLITTGAGAGVLSLAGCGKTNEYGPDVNVAVHLNAQDDASQRIIVNALGGLDNPNLRLESDVPFSNAEPPSPETIDPRALQDARASGVAAINVTLGYVAGPMDPFEHTIRQIAWWDARVRANPQHLIKVLHASDILDAHRSGRIGVIFGFQNSAMVGEDAGRITTFARLGVRVIQLTYNIANQVGHGAMSPANGGLTAFGRDVVAQLNADRVLIDLSHSGERTCLDALEASNNPVAITHSGCRALADLPRNKTDRELRRLAERGGVVGIYFMPFLRVAGQPMAADVVAHVEHALNVCGEDHVGIGTDGPITAIDDMAKYWRALAREVEERRKLGIGATGESAEIVPFIPDMRGPGQFEILAQHLADRGHAGSVIDKLLGRNFLRLMDEIWSGAGGR